MRAFRTEKRLEKIIAAVKSRQYSLRVVLENIHDPHNVSAIFRTCDAAGIPKISLLYTHEKFPKLSKTSSASANKWVEREKFTDVDECFTSLRNEGFKIYVSALTQQSVSLYDIDFTQKIAVVVGNEHRGVSEPVAKKADGIFMIPMYGMVQSLNVSVATAVTVYEAQRQRSLKGMYLQNELNPEELDSMIDEWCRKK